MTQMKVFLLFLLSLGFIPCIVFGSSLQIGPFDLAFRFEASGLSSDVEIAATNEVVSYHHSVTGFRKAFMDEKNQWRVLPQWNPTLVSHSQLLEQGVHFLVENGETNCVIRMSLTDELTALGVSLAARTEMVQSATAFLHSVETGTLMQSVTNGLRTRIRTISQNRLIAVPATCFSDEAVLASFSEMACNARFEPVCMTDIHSLSPLAGEAFELTVRVAERNAPAFENSISAMKLVYADGYWSFLF